MHRMTYLSNTETEIIFTDEAGQEHSFPLVIQAGSEAGYAYIDPPAPWVLLVDTSKYHMSQINTVQTLFRTTRAELLEMLVAKCKPHVYYKGELSELLT